MPFFLGRYEYAMDERGRVPVPPRYRDLFMRGAVLSQGPDPCLRLFPMDSFEEQASLYTAQPATERSGRTTRRSFFAQSFSVELDKQGRILVPGALREYAGLEGNAIVVGAGEWLEIWEPGRFDSEMASGG